MKKAIGKLLGFKKVKKAEKKYNVFVGPKVLQDIKRWEEQKSELIIRSSFNRDLYYKLLTLRK
jgi:hypothetical protein